MSVRCRESPFLTGLRVAAVIAAVALLPRLALATERFAIVVGNNLGHPYHERLQFSGRDADRFAKALIELGHFTPDHVTVLQEQSADVVRAAIARVGEQLSQSSAGREDGLLIFYYAGHANPAGLELGSDEFTYVDLKNGLNHSPARTRIAIVDACDSGSLTGVRGGHGDSTINIPLPAAGATEGTALLTSSALGEAAQESDTLQGGFFTSHLNAALRGAADADGDGLVTLSEAFRYTSTRTTTDTTWTRDGPQHPTIDWRLAGRSDVVLTDLRVAEASLILPPAEETLYVLHGPAGFVSEITGTSKALHVALPAGHYTVQQRHSGKLSAGEISLDRGETLPLPDLTRQTLIFSVARGSHLPLHFALGSGVTGSPGMSSTAFGAFRQSFSGAVSRPIGHVNLMLRLSYANVGLEFYSLHGALMSASARLAALWPLVHSEPALLEAGPIVGGGVLRETVSGNAPSLAGESMVGGLLMLTTGYRWMRFGPEVLVEAHLLNIGGALTLLPSVSAGFFVGF